MKKGKDFCIRHMLRVLVREGGIPQTHSDVHQTIKSISWPSFLPLRHSSAAQRLGSSMVFAGTKWNYDSMFCTLSILLLLTFDHKASDLRFLLTNTLISSRTERHMDQARSRRLVVLLEGRFFLPAMVLTEPLSTLNYHFKKCPSVYALMRSITPTIHH